MSENNCLIFGACLFVIIVFMNLNWTLAEIAAVVLAATIAHAILEKRTASALQFFTGADPSGSFRGAPQTYPKLSTDTVFTKDKLIFIK
jgi:hypothetical protein